MIQYELHDNEKLLIVKYIGNISKSSLISFFRFCVEKKYLSSMQVILADYRNAKEVYTIDDLVEITEARKSITKGLSEIKTIFLVTDPETTVIARLYLDYYKNHSSVSVCSTVGCCLNSLSLNVTKDELVRMLDNPKFEFHQ